MGERTRRISHLLSLRQATDTRQSRHQTPHVLKLSGKLREVNQALHRSLIVIFSFVLIFFVSVHSSAQTPKPKLSPTRPVEPKTEGQEPVKVFTEEVRLPVAATDTYGHYDPALEIDDVLVLAALAVVP